MREIHANGKASGKINEIVTLAQLATIADELGDIHTVRHPVFNRKNYLGFLDDREILTELENTAGGFSTYKEADARYRSLRIKRRARPPAEFLKYQQAELAKAKISPEEERN